MTKKIDCLIVGGGLAGLTCAVALADRGVQPWVLEASDRLGGRAQSWTDEVTGDRVDLGPHILLNVYSNMLCFLQRLGTENLIHWQTDGVIHQVSGTSTHSFVEAPLPAPFQLLPSMIRHPRISFADILSIRHIVALSLALDEQEILEYDSITVAELIQRAGSSPRMKELLWDFFSMSLLNLPSEEASAAAFLRVVRYFSGTRQLMPGLSKVGLAELFVDQSTQIIERAGGQVLLHHAVRSVENLPDGSALVHLEHGSSIAAKTVVMALAPQELARVLKKEQHPPGLDRFEVCPYLSVYLWFDQRISHREFWARTFHSDDLNCDFYDLSRFRLGHEGRGSIITSNIIYSGRVSRMSDLEVVEATRRELEEHIPEAKSARLLHWRVNHVPMAIHCPRPGMEALRPDLKSSVSSLILAGDWIRTGAPASMESACKSGYMAAEEVLRSLSHPDSNQKIALAIRGPKPSTVRAARFFAGLMRSRRL